MRDFNVVRILDKKVGGKVLSYNNLNDPNECMELSSLSNIRGTSSLWIWINKVMGTRRIAGRLDRDLRNEEWIDRFPLLFLSVSK